MVYPKIQHDISFEIDKSRLASIDTALPTSAPISTPLSHRNQTMSPSQRESYILHENSLNSAANAWKNANPGTPGCSMENNVFNIAVQLALNLKIIPDNTVCKCGKILDQHGSHAICCTFDMDAHNKLVNSAHKELSRIVHYTIRSDYLVNNHNLIAVKCDNEPKMKDYFTTIPEQSKRKYTKKKMPNDITQSQQSATNSITPSIPFSQTPSPFFATLTPSSSQHHQNSSQSSSQPSRETQQLNTITTQQRRNSRKPLTPINNNTPILTEYQEETNRRADICVKNIEDDSCTLIDVTIGNPHRGELWKKKNDQYYAGIAADERVKDKYKHYSKYFNLEDPVNKMVMFAMDTNGALSGEAKTYIRHLADTRSDNPDLATRYMHQRISCQFQGIRARQISRILDNINKLEEERLFASTPLSAHNTPSPSTMFSTNLIHQFSTTMSMLTQSTNTSHQQEKSLEWPLTPTISQVNPSSQSSNNSQQEQSFSRTPTASQDIPSTLVPLFSLDLDIALFSPAITPTPDSTIT